MPDVELDPSEWRLKGAKRIRPLKKQPSAPLGREAYSKPIFGWLATILAIWAAGILTWPPDTHRLVVYLVAFGPIVLTLFLMLIFDN